MRTTVALLALLAGGAVTGSAAAHASSTLCVGAQAGCYSTLQAAVSRSTAPRRSHALIVANTVTATGGAGAFVQGGGIANVGTTTLQRTLVLGNGVSANGPSGVAQGGGIWNGTFDDGDPLPSLTLLGSDQSEGC